MSLQASDELTELFGGALKRKQPRRPGRAASSSAFGGGASRDRASPHGGRVRGILKHGRSGGGDAGAGGGVGGTVVGGDPDRLAQVEAAIVIKVLVLGAARVGKSSVVRVCAQKHVSRTYAPTVGAELTVVHYGTVGRGDTRRPVMLHLWDVPHLELKQGASQRLQSLCRNVGAVVLMFDVSRPSTLVALDQWRDMLHSSLDVGSGGYCYSDDPHRPSRSRVGRARPMLTTTLHHPRHSIGTLPAAHVPIFLFAHKSDLMAPGSGRLGGGVPPHATYAFLPSASATDVVDTPTGSAAISSRGGASSSGPDLMSPAYRSASGRTAGLSTFSGLSGPSGLSASALDAYADTAGYDGWRWTTARSPGTSLLDGVAAVVRSVLLARGRLHKQLSTAAGLLTMAAGDHDHDSDGSEFQPQASSSGALSGASPRPPQPTLAGGTAPGATARGHKLSAVADVSRARGVEYAGQSAAGVGPSAGPRVVGRAPVRVPLLHRTHNHHGGRPASGTSACQLRVTVHHPRKRCMYLPGSGIAGTCATASSATRFSAHHGCTGAKRAAFPAPLTAVPTDAITTVPRSVRFFRRSGVALPDGAAGFLRVTGEGKGHVRDVGTTQTEPSGLATTVIDDTHTSSPASHRGKLRRAAWDRAASKKQDVSPAHAADIRSIPAASDGGSDGGATSASARVGPALASPGAGAGPAAGPGALLSGTAASVAVLRKLALSLRATVQQRCAAILAAQSAHSLGVDGGLVKRVEELLQACELEHASTLHRIAQLERGIPAVGVHVGASERRDYSDGAATSGMRAGSLSGSIINIIRGDPAAGAASLLASSTARPASSAMTPAGQQPIDAGSQWQHRSEMLRRALLSQFSAWSNMLAILATADCRSCRLT